MISSCMSSYDVDDKMHSLRWAMKGIPPHLRPTTPILAPVQTLDLLASSHFHPASLQGWTMESLEERPDGCGYQLRLRVMRAVLLQ